MIERLERQRRVRSTLLIQVPLLVLVAIVYGTAIAATDPGQASFATPPAPTSPTPMLRAPESTPKYGGVLRWAGLADAPFFDLHQCDTAACATPLDPCTIPCCATTPWMAAG